MGGREGPAADDGTYVDTWRAELLLSSEIHFVFFPRVCVGNAAGWNRSRKMKKKAE